MSLASGRTREWSPVMGMGWLSMLPGRLAWRWEGDDGRVLTLEAAALGVGPAEYQKILTGPARKYRDCDEEEAQWRTYTLTDGTVLSFRRGGPKPPEPASEEPASLPLPGVLL